MCVQAFHPLLTQLQDQVDICTYGLSIVLAPELIWRISYNGFVSKIAIALPYSRAHGSLRNGLIFRIPSVYYALDAHVRELLRACVTDSACFSSV